MKKSLLKQVAEHSKQRKKPLKNEVGMFVIANRDELKEALQNGYSVKAVWETLSADGRLKCTYAAFQQIKKEFKNTPVPQPAGREILTPKFSRKNKSNSDAFSYNPQPDEKELY